MSFQRISKEKFYSDNPHVLHDEIWSLLMRESSLLDGTTYCLLAGTIVQKNAHIICDPYYIAFREQQQLNVQDFDSYTV